MSRRPSSVGSDLPAGDSADLAPALRMAVARLARRLRLEDAGSGTTFSQLSALAVIEMYGPILLGDLAARERVQPPTVTRLVANLEGRGLVVRAGDPLDKRMFRVAITTAGERVLAKSRERRTAFLATTLRTLDPADRDALRQAIPILEQIAEA